jgi:arylformamidase
VLTDEPGKLAITKAGWIDVSVPLRTGMVHWPDNPPVRIERMLDIEHGDAANVSTLSMGSHTGTHMDAPLHFVRGGKGLDEMPFEATIGRARVIEIIPASAAATKAMSPRQPNSRTRVRRSAASETGWISFSRTSPIPSW